MASTSTTQSAPVQSASALYQAGFRGPALVLWTALSGVESGFGTNLTPDNDSNGTTDYGLLQINSSHYGSLAAPGQTQNAWVQQLINDPVYNARQGYTLSGNGTNFGPWGPDISGGAYLQYLPQSFAAAKQVSGQTTTAAQLADFITQQNKASASANPGYYNGNPALPSSNTPTTANLSSSTATNPTGSGTGAVGCSEKGNVFGEGGFLGIGSFSFTHCELKGLLGATFIVGGGFLCLAGIVLIFASSAKAKKVAAAGASVAAVVK